MMIRDILTAKGNRVETMWPERTVADAVARFDERSISSVVVTDHAGRLAGIVSDRDVLRALARRGAQALQLQIKDVMQTSVPTCKAGDSVAGIMHRMTFDRIRHVVVQDDAQRLTGVVSIGDVVKSRLEDADLESRVLRDRALSLLAAE